MSILIALFIVMTFISLIVIVSAVVVAAHSERSWNDRKDIEEFERAMQKMSASMPPCPPQPAADEDEKRFAERADAHSS